MRELREVCGGIIAISGKIDKPFTGQQWSEMADVDPTEIKDELGDLETCDPLLPPDAKAAGSLEIVEIHDYVDCEVESDRYPGHRSVSFQLGVAKESRGAVMVAVEESFSRSACFSTVHTCTHSKASSSGQEKRCREAQGT